MSKEYDQYLTEHVNNVYHGLQWMKNHLDLNAKEIDAIDMASCGKHDESKWTKEEYDAYDDYFYGGNRSSIVVNKFNLAWLHHIHNNPHHWQHWILVNDDPKDGTVALEMPLNYIFEMIADWWTFSWKTENLNEIFKWYDEHKDRIIFHKKTRKEVESILDKIKNKLEEISK